METMADWTFRSDQMSINETDRDSPHICWPQSEETRPPQSHPETHNTHSQELDWDKTGKTASQQGPGVCVYLDERSVAVLSQVQYAAEVVSKLEAFGSGLKWLEQQKGSKQQHKHHSLHDFTSLITQLLLSLCETLQDLYRSWPTHSTSPPLQRKVTVI